MGREEGQVVAGEEGKCSSRHCLPFPRSACMYTYLTKSPNKNIHYKLSVI